MSSPAIKKYESATAENARNELVVANLPFVRHVLGKIAVRLPSSVDFENLESAGILGLVEASHQFDPTHGVPFRTFAYPRVWGSIIDELRRNSPLPQKLMNMISRIRSIQDTLEPPVTVERLANETGFTIDEVEACLLAMRLSNPSPLCEKSLSNLFARNSPSVSARLESEEAKQRLADEIQKLPEQQRAVITMYYAEDLRMKEIGVTLGLSESRISRIVSATELRLRAAISDTGN